MNISLLLETIADGAPDRIAVGSTTSGLTYRQLLEGARHVAQHLRSSGSARAVLVDINSEAVPLLLFGAAIAGVPFAPLNYRLADSALRDIVKRLAPATVVVDADIVDRIGDVQGISVVTRDELLSLTASDETIDDHAPASADDVAVLLFTSGTSGDPKAALLRHRHLTSYILGTVDYLSAEADEAQLVSVPPYHVAGVSAVLSSTFAGRRIVYLPAFEAEDWVRTAVDEEITQAMVVPTMLGRILDEIGRRGTSLPALRHLSYGGGRMPVPMIERAIHLLPDVRWVNAYGLTETSSTIAVLGPDDHDEAFASTDPKVRARLGSVGRALPNVEIEIRDRDGLRLPPGEHGEIYVRGAQVAGEYAAGSGMDADGWFATRDGGYIDDNGYLFLEGRLDDVIVRGAENISPGEIEDVLLGHPEVAEAAVLGVPDSEWGEKVVAVVVREPDGSCDEPELQRWVRDRLRSTKTPAEVHFRSKLPQSDTGKILRRVLRSELTASV